MCPCIFMCAHVTVGLYGSLNQRTTQAFNRCYLALSTLTYSYQANLEAFCNLEAQKHPHFLPVGSRKTNFLLELLGELKRCLTVLLIEMSIRNSLKAHIMLTILESSPNCFSHVLFPTCTIFSGKALVVSQLSLKSKLIPSMPQIQKSISLRIDQIDILKHLSNNIQISITLLVSFKPSTIFSKNTLHLLNRLEMFSTIVHLF